MRDSEILKQAKRRIENGDRKFICQALSVEVTAKTHEQCLALHRWINFMLEGGGSLEHWLRSHSSEPKVTFLEIEANREKMQNTRLAWLDWMIAYCEAEECGVSPEACFAHAHIMIRGGK